MNRNHVVKSEIVREYNPCHDAQDYIIRFRVDSRVLQDCDRHFMEELKRHMEYELQRVANEMQQSILNHRINARRIEFPSHLQDIDLHEAYVNERSNLPRSGEFRPERPRESHVQASRYRAG